MYIVTDSDYRRANEDGGSKRELLEVGTEIVPLLDVNDWGYIKIRVVATGKTGYFLSYKIGQADPPPANPVPDVQITRVEGTVDGEPFLWQP